MIIINIYYLLEELVLVIIVFAMIMMIIFKLFIDIAVPSTNNATGSVGSGNKIIFNCIIADNYYSNYS